MRLNHYTFAALAILLVPVHTHALEQAAEPLDEVKSPKDLERAQEATSDVAEAADSQKVRCRKLEVTGSLVRKEKICKTADGWREYYRNGNANARMIADQPHSTHTNGK